MIKRIGILIVLLSAVCTVIFASELPQPTGWVNDTAGVISQEFKDKLTGLVTELEAKTSAEILVLTVDSIAPYDEYSYARKIFDSWKIGKKGKDNGVLVLVAVKERRWRIETGYGIEGILPDAVCARIGRDIIAPRLKTGNYGEGLYYGVAAVSERISADSGVVLDSLAGVPVEPSRDSSDISAIMVMFIFFVIFLMLLSAYTGGNRKNKGFWTSGGFGGYTGGGIGGGGFGGGGFGGCGGGGGGGGGGSGGF